MNAADARFFIPADQFAHNFFTVHREATTGKCAAGERDIVSKA